MCFGAQHIIPIFFLDLTIVLNSVIKEASDFQSGQKLRHLFAIILTHCEPQNVKAIWDLMSADLYYKMKKKSKEDIYGYALLEIEDILVNQSQTLKNYGIIIPKVSKRTEQLSRNENGI